MMNKYILYYMTILFVIIVSSIDFSQDALSYQLQIADSLYNHENYYDAVTEYKRLLFFDVNNQYGFTGNFMIGKCYKEGAKFSDAIRYFTLAEINARNDESLFDSEIEIIRCNILRRTTDWALTLLDSLSVNPKFYNKTTQIDYWRGWAYIFADKWDHAAVYFSKVDSAGVLKNLCDNVHKNKYSVQFASIISHIIPGSGQIYTGNYFSGFLSLGWNVLWAYTAITAFSADRIFDGFAVTNFLWLRFYNGNLQNAEKFAVQKNLKISNKALLFLQFKYHGAKP